MLVAKCLHRVVAREYAEICKADPSFEDFLLTVLPNLQLSVCSQCNPSCSKCGGENSEYHPNPDEFIFGLERVRLGFSEDDSSTYTQRQLSLLGYASSLSDENPKNLSRSFSLRNAIPVNLELLTGDPKIDRFQVAADLREREKHSSDYYSLQQELDDGLRTA